ncbi:MAG: thioesterase family protein [Candidatus Omnitrophica bacterium]|nr:thioesterase family protein [Candidatus Omnitrophota bacterium]
MKTQIYYHDTDCGGVVYYANYLKYLEEARTEFFAERNIRMKELIAHGSHFVVARQEIDYKSPAAYGDVLEVSSRILELSGVKLLFAHEIKNQEGRVVVQAKTLLVFVDKGLKPAAIPQDIKKKLEQK